MLVKSDFGGRCLIRLFKPVAVMMLLALVSPALLAMSNCLGQGLEATNCQPNCPMIAMGADASDQVAATPPSGSSCCQMSSPLPGNKQATITPRTQVIGNSPVVATASDAHPPRPRLMSVHETAPSVCTSSRQALLCIFLV